MKKQFKSVRILGYLLFAAVWMLTLLGMVKTLLVSTDIDEAYAVAQAYRLVKGDRLLLDMWEPHQLSAYLPAILMDVFIKVTDSINKKNEKRSKIAEKIFSYKKPIITNIIIAICIISIALYMFIEKGENPKDKEDKDKKEDKEEKQKDNFNENKKLDE